jgi:hypothetical protein
MTHQLAAAGINITLVYWRRRVGPFIDTDNAKARRILGE